MFGGVSLPDGRDRACLAHADTKHDPWNETRPRPLVGNLRTRGRPRMGTWPAATLERWGNRRPRRLGGGPAARPHPHRRPEGCSRCPAGVDGPTAGGCLGGPRGRAPALHRNRRSGSSSAWRPSRRVCSRPLALPPARRRTPRSTQSRASATPGVLNPHSLGEETERHVGHSLRETPARHRGGRSLECRGRDECWRRRS